MFIFRLKSIRLFEFEECQMEINRIPILLVSFTEKLLRI